MGTCSVFTRLAGTITPMFGSLLLETGYFIPFLTYGVALVIAGVCSLCLRTETLNSSLQDVSFAQKPYNDYVPLINDSEPLLNEPSIDEEDFQFHQEEYSEKQQE